MVVFITVQNLVGIYAVVLIICTFFDFASVAWKRLFGYISPMCPETPRGRICTQFRTAVGVADVITCDKCFGDRLRVVDSVGVENCPFPLTKPVAVNTSSALQIKSLSSWLVNNKDCVSQTVDQPRLETVRYRNTRQAVHFYSSPPSPYTSRTHTSHTYQFPPLPGLAHWTNIKVSALGSRVGWTSARNNERTNERTNDVWPIK